MTDLERRLREALEGFVSPIHAGVLLERARRAAGARALEEEGQLARCLPALLKGAALFVADARLAELRRAVERVVGIVGAPEARRFPIEGEPDVRACRLAARDIAARLGARSLTQQRVATVVSELCRNIVAYTPGGELLLEPLPGPAPALRIVARDRGSGIQNLEQVLSGSYRSRTGLGRGLLATRELMDRFDVQTGPEGTRIEVEAKL